jgi:regulatory protein
VQTKSPNTPKKIRPPRKITADYLHNAGLYYLQRFAASSGQFRTVMLRKVKKSCRFHTSQDYTKCTEMVEELIKKFEGTGLLDDKAYARGMVTSLRRQGKSKRAIASKLNVKNLSNNDVEEALDQYNESFNASPRETELQAGLIFARKKKIGPFRRAEEMQEKELAAFGRAGFSYDTALSILKFSLEEAEEQIKL